MLVLDRNAEGRYELSLHGEVLSKFDGFQHAVEVSKQTAKNYKKNLQIAQGCLSDWYCGFPKDPAAAPIVFLERQFSAVTASLESPDSLYRFVEGPFLEQSDAAFAAFKISGKEAVLSEPKEFQDEPNRKE
jgi:hypothetical protein